MKKLRSFSPKGYVKLTFNSGFTILCKSYERHSECIVCMKYYTMSTDREGVFHSWSLNRGKVFIYEPLLRLEEY